MKIIYPTNHLSIRASKLESGSVLIEALVAMLILSFGLLGIAGLQINALSYQKSSVNIHRISELVTDISEKIRANPVAANVTGNYSFTQSYPSSNSATFTLNNCRALTSSCTPEQIADDDIATWVQKAQQSLPEGGTFLTGDAKSGYEVTVIWKEKDNQNTASACTTTLTGVDWRNCCPSSSSAQGKTGVKCHRALITP
jgi:type IV pilus assembly protein PilV